jgi:hypothetical protein
VTCVESAVRQRLHKRNVMIANIESTEMISIAA